MMSVPQVLEYAQQFFPFLTLETFAEVFKLMPHTVAVLLVEQQTVKCNVVILIF
jgi:hypothetical protein